ncbi:MAG: 3-dehydroquinate synthase [Deltaproteobacteria bacterium]|nr:3-dehydroquinate synthase [Deltaproteobacteria bacterium]
MSFDTRVKYEIRLEAGGFDGLAAEVARVAPGRRAVLVTDRNVFEHHGSAVRTELERGGREVLELVVPAGEPSKTVARAGKLWDALVRAGVDRSTPLLALGGGVVGDLGGFVASTYLRGIPLIQVPTTLLAQVDSAIGGKTAVDHALGKNLIGAFYQPRAVFASMAALETLPDREYRAGLAEVVKAGVIGDAELFERMEADPAAVLERRPALLRDLVRRALAVKADVVSHDPNETGLRAVLNLGHTLAHAIEKIEGYRGALHGEAVAIGLASAARLSKRRGWTSAEVSRRICALLEAFGLPTRRPGLTVEEVQVALVRDKKTVGDSVRFVAPASIGGTTFHWVPVASLARQLVAAAA